jgi:SAM-dependent methyltransferase
MVTLRKTARRTLNRMLSSSGFELVRHGERDHIKSYISFRQTIKAASEARLTVGDYIDEKYHVPGATQATIDDLTRQGIFDDKIGSVCEIGPGSGRYLEKIQRLSRPCSYEIYETDKEWSDWLERTYHVVAHAADGMSLCDTASGSVDLVHAHKVFVYLPFIVTFKYFGEMIRVTRPGGKIIFDIVSESCMSDATIDQWITSRTYSRCMIPRDFVIGFFARRQCLLRSSFLAPTLPGQSEYLIFAK